MITISLQRKGHVLKEEYGQIRYDGSKVSFHGLTSVFVNHLQMGVKTFDNRLVKPEQGIDFIKTIKDTFSSSNLVLTAIDCDSDSK